MKKTIIALALFVLFTPLAQAAILASDNSTTFQENQMRDLQPITITAQADGEITVAHGMDLFFNPDDQLLWNVVPSLTASGTAVDHGKISASIVPIYKNQYSVLHIPVLLDFANGEAVTLQGVQVRAYRHAFNEDFIRLDLNGDGVADAVDVNKLQVLTVLGTDFTPPYSPSNVTATLSADLKSVTLTWVQSPDYDQLGTNLSRRRTRNGNIQDISLFENRPFTTYTDTDILPGDTLVYTLTASDGSNFSDPVIKMIEVKAATPAPTNPTPPVVSPTPTPTPTPSTGTQTDETKQLTSLYGYYKVRQSIKCRVGIDSGDSACLWAKIDLVYAQNVLGRSDVKIELTTRDLALIASRIVWPEKRYQTECVQVSAPANSCPALQKSIQRAHYFIDHH